MLYGYEVDVKYRWRDTNPKVGANLFAVTALEDTTVRPNFVNNGGILRGIAPPTPTIKSQANMVAAFYKRVAMSHSVHHPERIKFGAFILEHYIPWLLSHMGEVKVMTDDEYIDTLEVTKEKKEALKEICAKLRIKGYILDPRLRIIQAFIKLEFYEVTGKFPRVIMPQDEASRAAFGAPLHAVNHCILRLPSSIKAIPFNERPKWLRDKFGDDEVSQNDFSCYESSSDKWMIINVLRPIFLALSFPADEARIGLYFDLKVRKQLFKYGKMMFYADPVMRSGDLDTASGNFFVNDAAIAYASWVSGGLGVDHPRAVEGDDSVFKRIEGIEQIFKNLGFTAKLENKDHVRDAVFCRVYCGGTAALTDGIYVVSKLGWSSAQYIFASKEKKTGLLKAKCMSYICQYSGCPIVSPLCDKILNTIENIEEVSNKDWWEREKMKFWKPELRNKKVLDSDRTEYERLFGITPEDQKIIEQELIDSVDRWDKDWKNDIENFLESPTAVNIVNNTKPGWTEYYADYAHVVDSDKFIKERFNYRREKPWSCDFQDHIYHVHNKTKLGAHLVFR